MTEPELITIVEGPTPDFQELPQLWNQSIFEGPQNMGVTFCELRTLNGLSIMDRCKNAWNENRPVLLDYPDQMRLRQQIPVVAARLREVAEGTILVLWVSQPINESILEDVDDADDEGLTYF